MASNKELAEKSASEAKPMQRRPLTRSSVSGARNVLRLNKTDPGYVYRIANDVGDRVEELKERGYEVVTDPSVRVGDRRAGKVGQVGSPVTAHVGQGTKAVVMRQRKEWYDEDQRTKAEAVKESEDAMFERARKEESDYGKIKVS